MKLQWVQALREHGTAYQQCKDYLEQLKREVLQDLARTNPERQYTVAKTQGHIKCLDDLIQAITTEERKEQVDARRQLTLEHRSSGKLRRIGSK